MENFQNHRNTYFLNHFHTQCSNRYYNEIVDSENSKGQNHFGSPTEILKKLDKGENAVAVITEHYKTNGQNYFQEIAERIERLGGCHDISAYSLDLELDGSRMRIMNGVELSYKEDSNHIILGGLRLDDNQEYSNLDKENLRKAADKAAYGHPAHPFAGPFGMKEKTLDDVCSILDDSKAKLLLPETHAYGLGDLAGRGTLQKVLTGKKDVYQKAEQYNADLIPEHDHHLHLPSRMNGIGLLNDSAINHQKELSAAASQEELPIVEIKNLHIIETSIPDQIKDTIRFWKTYADLLPFWKENSTLMKKLGIPTNKKEFTDARNKFYQTISTTSIEEVKNRSHALNQ